MAFLIRQGILRTSPNITQNSSIYYNNQINSSVYFLKNAGAPKKGKKKKKEEMKPAEDLFKYFEETEKELEENGVPNWFKEVWNEAMERKKIEDLTPKDGKRYWKLLNKEKIKNKNYLTGQGIFDQDV
eukprot:TRINITY_DN194_c4_g1_i1.p1 TRINITY_DN194_c4_g1~~TRINITY_DN194_c4_g1_i1.p1  ORF type:complete len:128 (-),score=54.00 TRINITY_DN194_c4_g1_i1:47-430(-)